MTTYTCPDGHATEAADYCDVCGAPVGAASAVPAAPPADATAADATAADAAAAPAASAASGPAPSGPAPSSLDLDASPPPVPAPAPVSAKECPNCTASNLTDALFCENCGYDFTTGQLPRPLAPPDAGGPAVGSSDGGALVQPPPSAPADPQLPPSAKAPAGVEWVVEVWVDPDWHAAQDVDDPCPSAGMPVVVPLHLRSVLIGRTSTSRNIHPEIDVVGDTGVSRRHAQLSTDGQRWWVEDLQSANGTYLGAAGQPLPADPIAPGSRVELPDDGRLYLGAWTRLVVRKASPSEQDAP